MKLLAYSIALSLAAAPALAAGPKYYHQTAAPATCTVGDLWIDTDATAGNQISTCTAANTWTKNQSLVGDCTVGPCLDGSADGGNLIKLWAGTGSYWTALQGGAPEANRSWRLPIAAAPATGETLVMTMDEYGQMGFLPAPETSGYVLSSTDAGVLSWAAGGSGGGDDLGSAAYSDVVALWTTCTGYLKSDGTCDTPSGIGILPSGTENQILQHNGTTWAASSTLAGIGNITGAGSYNNVTITQPATGATLTLVEGSTLATSGAYSITLTSTGTTNVTLPTTGTLLSTADVDDTPVNGVTTAPVSSNWAYDHVAASDPHTGYVLESAIGTTVQAYDADLTAWAGITPSTGNLKTTGTIQGNIVFNSYTAAQTLTYADHNSSIVQMTTADEVTMWDCETAGVGATVMLWARDAEKIEVVPASGDHFNLFNGTALAANNEMDMAATAGTKVTLMCTADDTWSVYSETAASTDGGAAD